MKYKRWMLGMLAFVLLVLAGIGSLNYFVDPYDYFAYVSGDYKDLSPVDGKTGYVRLLKLTHVKKFADQYEGYILGGSKAGSYRTEKLAEMDGYRYYNMHESLGTFHEYEETVRYLLEIDDPKKIVLNISGRESTKYDLQADGAAVNQFPAVMTGESRVLEYIDFLLKDVKAAFEKLEQDQILPEFEYFTGERNLTSHYRQFFKDRDRKTARYPMRYYENYLKTLFTRSIEGTCYRENLDSMRRIKEMCDQAQTELLVIVAPVFISERSYFEEPEYWDFLAELAAITDYWDFSAFCDVNMNPYNFYDPKHFYYEMGDEVVETIMGNPGYEGFGVHVTLENCGKVLKKREKDYYRYKKEYEETRTILLKGYEDSCTIPLEKSHALQ